MEIIKAVRPNLKKCYVASRTEKTVQNFIEAESLKFADMQFIPCGNKFEKAAEDADIIVTATSGQSELLKASWIKKGTLYIHVGGLEDEYAVAQKANKIVCDEWASIKHRTQTLSLMYKKGLLQDDDIYADLGDIVVGNKQGRENEDEFIYFCSVGLPFIDIVFANYVYEKCREKGLGVEFVFN